MLGKREVDMSICKTYKVWGIFRLFIVKSKSIKLLCVIKNFPVIYVHA